MPGAVVNFRHEHAPGFVRVELVAKRPYSWSQCAECASSGMWLVKV